MYGTEDLRLETFELPEIREDEILVKVVCDSVCMSTYKAWRQGANHKRVPDDVAINPIIVGHEMAGDIIAVGKKYEGQFIPGQKFSLQPALNYKGSPYAPGYSYGNFGGNATYNIIPQEVMELGCLLVYDGQDYFGASLGEPMSCIIGGYHANYHTVSGRYEHVMGIKPGGALAILGGAGPMGLGAIDYALSLDAHLRPSILVVTDADAKRISRAEALIAKERALKLGVALHYVDVTRVADALAYMMRLTDGKGFDDVFVYAPIQGLVEQADQLLGHDGCINFFAGPNEHDFSATINMYRVHYANTHIMGSTGGNTDDLKEALTLAAAGRINPSVMVTHIGGMDAAIPTIEQLPKLPGAKKLIYNHIKLPLTAIEDFEELGHMDARFSHLHKLCEQAGGLWNQAAESYLLDNFALDEQDLGHDSSVDAHFTLTLTNEHGLHARPAGLITKLCHQITGDVKIRKDDITVDGKSLLGLLRLGATHGTKLDIMVNGVSKQAFESFKSQMENLLTEIE